MDRLAEFHFMARLGQLISSGAAVDYRFAGRPGIKDAIEALGVPHTEVDLILVNGHSVDFRYQLRNRDGVQVFPFGAAPTGSELLHLSPPLPREPAFVLDVHLGKLARRLRLLGFDCRYRNDYRDPQIIELALAQGLVILTRDRGILKHARVRLGYLVGSQRVEEQVREVLERYRLFDKLRPLFRCPVCNGLLQTVTKGQVVDRLPAKTARYYDDFRQCRRCSKLYWRGAHHRNIAAFIKRLELLSNRATL